MKRPKISLSSTRAKIITASIVTLAILTISVTAAYYQTSYTYSQTSAQGSFSMTWGDPYLTAKTAQGTGYETMTVKGNVARESNLPGYYAYTTMTLSGSVHLEWSGDGNNYVLDASVSQTGYESGYERTTVNPAGNSFYVSFVDYTSTITVNGVATHKGGYAGIKAAAPGFFTQQGQARSTIVILYAPSLGDPQFVIRWSEASQLIDGAPQPAASRYTQTVTMTGSG